MEDKIILLCYTFTIYFLLCLLLIEVFDKKQKFKNIIGKHTSSNFVKKISGLDVFINKFGNRKIVIIICVFFLILVSVISQSDNNIIVQLVAVLFILFAIYVCYFIYLKLLGALTNYVVGMREMLWSMLYICPFILVAMELQAEKMNAGVIKRIYGVGCMAFEIVLIFGMMELMRKIMFKEEETFMRMDTKKYGYDEKKVYSVIAIVLIQLECFIAVTYSLSIRVDDIFNIYSYKINKLIDIVYFVIMTYTTIGYGDIHPTGFIGKVLACVISVTAFFTTCCLISVLIDNQRVGRNSNNM